MMLSQKQLTTLEKQLIALKNDMRGNADMRENEITAHDSLRDSVDELSTVDNHPADLATELYDREKDLALKVHNEDLLAQVNAALEKIGAGTYGVCAKCEEAIPYDRLRAIPYTAFCMKDTEAKNVPTDRPVEEDVLLPPVDNSFRNREAGDDLPDDEDTFQMVAQYGNSDTPADFEGDYADYNELYEEKGEDSPLDELHVSEHDALGGQISQDYADRARWDDYVE
ncbi:MAG: TraR/DksA C4-type zinc finger protein [Solibacillus sp.]